MLNGNGTFSPLRLIYKKKKAPLRRQDNSTSGQTNFWCRNQGSCEIRLFQCSSVLFIIIKIEQKLLFETVVRFVSGPFVHTHNNVERTVPSTPVSESSVFCTYVISRCARLQGGLSPDRQGRDVSPGRQRRRRNYRRQSTTMGSYNVRSCQSSRSPESSSSCSSREPSPAGRAVAPAASHRTPIIRRQSTTEEILIARGFRRQVRALILFTLSI